MLDKMVRAARLEANFYAKVEADTSLNQEALTVKSLWLDPIR